MTHGPTWKYHIWNSVFSISWHIGVKDWRLISLLDVKLVIHHTLVTTGTCSSDTVMMRLTLIGIFCCFFSGPVHGCKGKGPRTPAPNPGPVILDQMWVVISYKLTETGHIFEHFLWSNFKLFVLFARDGLDYQYNYQDYQHNQRFNCVNGSHPCQDHHDCDDCTIGGVDCYTDTVQYNELLHGKFGLSYS